ncbi:MAG: hypothetical protein GXP41_06360 [Chloroflexi bacterium]|nr:hypothetical protein [Chloroflexota bacterium]
MDIDKYRRYVLVIVALTAILAVVTGCGGGSKSSLRDTLRQYLYEKQPSTASEFISFANKELTGYTSRQILDALYDEGKHQAALGHPSAVGVLSQFAAGYASTKGASYDSAPWVKLQEKAIKKRIGKETPTSLWGK